MARQSTSTTASADPFGCSNTCSSTNSRSDSTCRLFVKVAQTESSLSTTTTRWIFHFNFRSTQFVPHFCSNQSISRIFAIFFRFYSTRQCCRWSTTSTKSYHRSATSSRRTNAMDATTGTLFFLSVKYEILMKINLRRKFVLLMTW